jgi:hypothetical protein
VKAHVVQQMRAWSWVRGVSLVDVLPFILAFHGRWVQLEKGDWAVGIPILVGRWRWQFLRGGVDRKSREDRESRVGRYIHVFIKPVVHCFPTAVDRADRSCRLPSQLPTVQSLARAHGYLPHHVEAGVTPTGLRAHPPPGSPPLPRRRRGSPPGSIVMVVTLLIVKLEEYDRRALLHVRPRTYIMHNYFRMLQDRLT